MKTAVIAAALLTMLVVGLVCGVCIERERQAGIPKFSPIQLDKAAGKVAWVEADEYSKRTGE